MSLVVCLGAASFLLTACNDGRKPLYPARGKVVDAAGNGVAGASVILHPVDGGPDANLHKPAANTNAQGEFVLTTYTMDDGAPAGEYVATVEWRGAPKGPGDSPPDKLNGKFRDPKTSPYKMTVTKGANDLPPIKLP
jgi:hypothetical protein